MAEKKKVLVIYGGKSTEHEVSRRSAAFLLKNLDPLKYDVEAVAITKTGRWLKQKVLDLLPAAKSGGSIPINESKHELPSNALLLGSGDQTLDAEMRVVFPIIHGTGGEDGTLQGFLDLCEMPYVGPDTMGSAIGMDKVVTKRLAEAAGVPVVPFIDIKLQFWMDHESDIVSLAEDRLGYPIFIKPARLGSSVGVNKARDKNELRKYIQTAFEFDDKVLLEKGMEVREIECAVLGDYNPDVSIPGEVLPQIEFYTYDAKYLMTDGAKMKIPADLSREKTLEAQNLSKRIFQALELYGMARVDLFLEKATDTFYLNEVNTIPGFTSISQYPMLWEASGLSNSALLDRLIELAIKRHQTKKKLKRSM